MQAENLSSLDLTNYSLFAIAELVRDFVDTLNYIKAIRLISYKDNAGQLKGK